MGRLGRATCTVYLLPWTSQEGNNCSIIGEAWSLLSLYTQILWFRGKKNELWALFPGPYRQNLVAVVPSWRSYLNGGGLDVNTNRWYRKGVALNAKENIMCSPYHYSLHLMLPVLEHSKKARNSLIFQKCAKCTLTLMSNYEIYFWL